MPKIRQAIAVLAAAAFCIGFNTLRYPVVREMVAAVSRPAQSTEPKPAEKPTGAAGHADTAASKRAGVSCKDGVCTMPLPDSPTASLDSGAGYGASDMAKPADEKQASVAGLFAKQPEAKSDPPGGMESQSQAFEEARPDSKPGDTTEWKPKEEAARSDLYSPTSEPAKPDASAYGDSSAIPADPADRSRAETPGARTPARLASASAAAGTFPSAGDTPPAEEAALIPIERPRSRANDAATAAAPPVSDPNRQTAQDAAAQAVRHLPPVDVPPSTDAPSLTAEMVSTYRVTPAK